MEHRDDAHRPERHHRPALFADLTDMIDAAGGASPESRAELASATADVLVRSGRSLDDGVRFVDLADEIGLDTLAALWRDADPVSLPGALWALYLLRQWCRQDADEVARLWRLGEPQLPADVAVAGMADYLDTAAVHRFADTVLGGIYQRDLAVALERAAAFFRVIAAGRRTRAVTATVSTPDDAGAEAWAERNDRTASALTAAAKRWREGTLR